MSPLCGASFRGRCDYRRTSGHVIPSRELHVDCVLRLVVVLRETVFQRHVKSSQVLYLYGEMVKYMVLTSSVRW